jgi:hypothetical protein
VHFTAGLRFIPGSTVANAIRILDHVDQKFIGEMEFVSGCEPEKQIHVLSKNDSFVIASYLQERFALHYDAG